MHEQSTVRETVHDDFHAASIQAIQRPIARLIVEGITTNERAVGHSC